MSQKRYLCNKGSSSLEDTPFMVLLSVTVITFIAVFGIRMTTSFMDQERHATAVDSAEKIYHAGDLLSAGASGSSRTLWVKIPEGYSIDFGNDYVNLRKDGEKIGYMGIENVGFKGEPLSSGKQRLKLEYRVDYFNNSEVYVSVIA